MRMAESGVPSSERGIPPQHRRAIWMRLSGAEQLREEHGSDYARSMLEGLSGHDNDPLLVKAEIEIDKDIARTLTDKMTEGFTDANWNADEFHVRLKRLLLAYARHNR
jgi:hypothetical protein